MKTKKVYLAIVTFLLGTLIGNDVCAQYSPGTKLPSIQWPSDRDYDIQVGDKGFVRMVGINPSTPMEQRCYSIFAGGREEERFRVSANGTVSIISPYSYPAGTVPSAELNFYLGGGYSEYSCLGRISCNKKK